MHFSKIMQFSKFDDIIPLQWRHQLWWIVFPIDAGSRGAAAPWRYFGPPWDSYPGQFLGQKYAPNPAKTFFFLENSCFWQKDTPNPAKTFFLENACFGLKNTPISAKNFISRSRLWRSRCCPPCPKIVPAPLVFPHWWLYFFSCKKFQF